MKVRRIIKSYPEWKRKCLQCCKLKLQLRQIKTMSIAEVSREIYENEEVLVLDTDGSEETSSQNSKKQTRSSWNESLTGSINWLLPRWQCSVHACTTAYKVSKRGFLLTQHTIHRNAAKIMTFTVSLKNVENREKKCRQNPAAAQYHLQWHFYKQTFIMARNPTCVSCRAL